MRPTGRLFATLEQIDDSVAPRPSLLPGWSVAHVLTHLARNADSFVRMLAAAAEGREARQYPAGSAGRNQDIEDGRKRPAAEIIDDLRASSVRLDATWSDLVPPMSGSAMAYGSTARRSPVGSSLPGAGAKLELHHVDLGLGYPISDWPGEFVKADLPHGARPRARAASRNRQQQAALLAWIYGRLPNTDGVVLRPF